jgi:hypothetical protein
MFRSIVLLVVTCAIGRGFHLHRTPFRLQSSKLAMSAEDLVGSLAPVGFFDPLGLSKGVSGKKLVKLNFNKPLIDKDLKRWREAELKHGRVAMLAFIGILVGESFNPLFGGQITGPAIYQFQKADEILSFFWEIVLFAIALVEGKNILIGWESPGESLDWIGGLKANYINGDLGFDPLGFKPKDPNALRNIQTKELQNGRLAMLGVAGIVAQELVNGKTILENFS